ncbi:hypothetical protein LCGC14_1859620, partial [marine sediment metagenome]
MSQEAENERLGITHDSWLQMRAERDAAVERGVEVWRQTIRQRRALMLGLKLIGIEHAQDHEALEETLAENE